MREAGSIEIGHDGNKPIYLAPQDRRTHLHIIGPSNSGKTRLLEHMIKQDIRAGNGICVIDPTGNLYHRLMLWCTARGMQRHRNIHFIDPNSDDWVPGFNPLQLRGGEDVAKRADTMVQACARVWSENTANTPLLKRTLRVVFTSLIEHQLSLVEGVDLVLSPTNPEEEIVHAFLTEMLENPYAKRVWARFNKMKAERFEEAFSSTNNRMADFLMSERMSRIFGQGTGSIDFQKCMDENHVVLVNLQPLKISADNARLLGTLITNELLHLARSRDNTLAEKNPFYCYIDEAYRYLTEDIEQAIDETRQKGLHYILAHQRLSQLSQAGESIYGGVMSIRNKIIFGDLTAEETDLLARELFQAEYDENAEVDVLRRPVVVDYELRKNKQARTTQSNTESKTSSAVESRTQSESDSSLLSLPIDPLGAPTTGNFVDGGGMGTGKGRGQARGKAYGTAVNQGVTEGWAESAWPILEERTGSIRSFDDQMRAFAKRIRALPERNMLLKLRAQPPRQIKVPYVGDPITHKRRLPGFLEEIAMQSPFIRSLNEADKNLKERRGRLLAKARASRHGNVIEDPVDYFE